MYFINEYFGWPLFFTVSVVFVIRWLHGLLRDKPIPVAELFSGGELARHSFKPWQQPASKYLSVIVPAYNEEDRLHLGLDDCLAHLTARAKRQADFTFEVIVVDDGSSDRTVAVAESYVKQYGADVVRVLQLASNCRKGGAVRRGALCARGQYILMMDADGATRFSDYDKLDTVMRSGVEDARGFGVVVGSRKHLEKEAIARRSLFRTVLMLGFHFLVATIGGVTCVQDTQCGYKLFTRRSARLLFQSLHVERWAFDVELLYLATRHYRMNVREQAVHWTEVDGSKVSIAGAIPQMLFDLLRMRAAYVTGIWLPCEDI